jgi:hypothetical protein
MFIKKQHIIIHAGSKITASFEGDKKPRAMTLDEDVVAWMDGQDEAKVIRVEYDNNFGNHKICTCGHEYVLHFDRYRNMEPMPCQCGNCKDFVLDEEATKRFEQNKSRISGVQISGKFLKSDWQVVSDEQQNEPEPDELLEELEQNEEPAFPIPPLLAEAKLKTKKKTTRKSPKRGRKKYKEDD